MNLLDSVPTFLAKLIYYCFNHFQTEIGTLALNAYPVHWQIKRFKEPKFVASGFVTTKGVAANTEYNDAPSNSLLKVTL